MFYLLKGDYVSCCVQVVEVPWPKSTVTGDSWSMGAKNVYRSPSQIPSSSEAAVIPTTGTIVITNYVRVPIHRTSILPLLNML